MFDGRRQARLLKRLLVLPAHAACAIHARRLARIQRIAGGVAASLASLAFGAGVLWGRQVKLQGVVAMLVVLTLMALVVGGGHCGRQAEQTTGHEPKRF